VRVAAGTGGTQLCTARTGQPLPCAFAEMSAEKQSCAFVLCSMLPCVLVLLLSLLSPCVSPEMAVRRRGQRSKEKQHQSNKAEKNISVLEQIWHEVREFDVSSTTLGSRVERALLNTRRNITREQVQTIQVNDRASQT